MALMSSGLVGQQFCFHGYLPAKKEFLREALIKIGQQALKTNATQLFMETPYRNKQMFEIALSVLQQDLYLCVASNLGAPNELIQTKTIKY
jgi:16S rRNA (cytidine1402-2'-O)-methyltransferase